MKEKNKGFTLVELLAVIVILALIALIATPIILNVINDAKKQAAKDSAYGYMDAVEKYIVSSELEDKSIKDRTYSVEELNNMGVSVKGSTPDNGNIEIKNSSVKSYDIGIDNCNSKIMDAGVIDGKRYFIPLFYSPDVFITTEETLNKYNLTSSEFSFKALSEKLSKNKKEYSLFGSADDNIAFFYSFLDQYIDFNSGNTEFNSDKFSEDLDSIYSLIKNDTTDENVYYFLYENINNGASILYKEMPAFSIIVKTYSCLKYLGSTPVFVNNYNMDDDSISASIDVGIAVNDNCKNKEKLLPFIKYCLSCDVQKNMSEEYMYLPVNSDAMEKCIDSIDEAIDFGDLIVSDKEKAIVETAQSAAIRDYKYIINNITKCNLYGFNYLSDTYFNSSVISDIVDKYLNGDISKEKFIRQLSAATEIYLTE